MQKTKKSLTPWSCLVLFVVIVNTGKSYMVMLLFRHALNAVTFLIVIIHILQNLPYMRRQNNGNRL